MKYKSLSINEEEKFWEMINRLDRETKYMLYEPGERIRDLSVVENRIQNSLDGEDFLLVAETDDKLVGYISAQR